MSVLPVRPPPRTSSRESIPMRPSLDNSDLDYYKIRDALLQDSTRDIRIHNWISSQYDFALSESEFDEYPKACAPSRADSPLLGYSDPSLSTFTSSPASSQEAVDSDTYSCPSYDTLFFPDASQEKWSTADQDFEDGERERALKSLIEDMTIWESLDTSREKTLPPLPTRAPPCTPYSTPSRSRAASHSHSKTHSLSRSRSQRLPSITSALESASVPIPDPRVSEVLYVDHSTEMELPTPTSTPAPISTRSPAPAPLNLFTTFESLRLERELAGESPVSPTMTSTTNRSTPALTPSSPLSLTIPRQRSIGSMVGRNEHHRNESFPDSLVTASSGASPDTEEYMTPASDLSSWRLPTLELTTFPTTSDSGDEYAGVAPRSHLRDMNNLCVPQAACESRWSLGSSIPEEDEVADDEGKEKEKEGRKTPSKRRRLMSLISLLSPTTEKKEKEVKEYKTGNITTPPSPTNSSVYLPTQESDSAPVINASSLSLNPSTSTPAPLADNPYYDPYYDTSHSDSSLPSHPVIKMGSLVSLGYSSRSLVKPKKRKLIVSGVGRDSTYAYEAVKEWCEAFGELRSISRKENGEIHVDWRKASVADTVCRIRAGVVIHGAGSVKLSWYTGKSKTP